jgi:hypothetical protein
MKKMESQRVEGEKGNGQGLKRILVKFVGGTREPQEVHIGPGTTAADLLRELRLDKNGFFVSKGAADSIFGADESLYPSLEDGGLVYVSSRVDAGQ